MTPERLSEALEAWNSGDADRVLAYFAEDCSYHASFGPELLGRSYEGWDAVREGVRAFFERYPGGRFEDTQVFVSGDRARPSGRSWPTTCAFTAATCSSFRAI